MITLRSALADYLAMRRALGYKLRRSEKLLLQFIDYVETAGADHVTTDLALDWARLPASGDLNWWSGRLSVVRKFASFPNFRPPMEARSGGQQRGFLLSAPGEIWRPPVGSFLSAYGENDVSAVNMARGYGWLATPFGVELFHLRLLAGLSRRINMWPPKPASNRQVESRRVIASLLQMLDFWRSFCWISRDHKCWFPRDPQPHAPNHKPESAGTGIVSGLGVNPRRSEGEASLAG